MKLLKKLLCITGIFVILASSFALCAFAANWDNEVTNGTYSLITGEPYVADKFCGVEARYSLVSPYYQCNELVMRFYKEAYNLDVIAVPESLGGLYMGTTGYEFKQTDTPKPGDVVYAPSRLRGGSGDHWAIIKSVDNGKAVLFEQNVGHGGKAGTGRVMTYPSNNCYIYTPVAKAGYSAPVLKNAPAVPTTAAPATAAPTTAAATTAAATTAAPTTAAATTAAATTAAPATAAPTTAAPATSAPTTAAPATTAARTTAAPKTTAKQAPKTTAAQIPETETMIVFITEESTTDPYGETWTFVPPPQLTLESTTVQPVTRAEEKGGIGSRLKPVIIAAAAMAAVIGAAAAVIVIKKK